MELNNYNINVVWAILLFEFLFLKFLSINLVCPLGKKLEINYYNYYYYNYYYAVEELG